MLWVLLIECFLFMFAHEDAKATKMQSEQAADLWNIHAKNRKLCENPKKLKSYFRAFSGDSREGHKFWNYRIHVVEFISALLLLLWIRGSSCGRDCTQNERAQTPLLFTNYCE